MANVGPYSNQCAAPFNAWHEQGCTKVNGTKTKYQIQVGMPPMAPPEVKKLFVLQLHALNHLKNASGLGHHCEEDMVEVHGNKYSWTYIDNRNSPYLRIVHPMFMES
ncbi:uncharacterized protein EI90DRAFT_3014536 [Cantharellus anzutake]|uniref:uncharacterized protein n=1 Tax=Cantharellus anzutake TaxID=1750568 RepID=UPI0019079562|nr:uncharacterized protein EI90DRAFT_3014536 [Cantharellus anzutake]KAF8335954.1 hypothetical protein EI90DRAFT_3014536 [Cantharellus anzutake]